MMQVSVLSRALSAFDDIAAVAEKYNTAGAIPVRKMVAHKRASPNPIIMVYGVYNAGKSTLINALLGEADRAPVADKPQTDKVDTYQWREFEILDTPGIDAPISHEEVTRQQLFSVDMVIFVVNPLGVVEEAKTLSTLLELVARKKKIVLVFNCKNKLEPMDAARLKDQLRQRLQDMALEKGLKQVLQSIPIHEVNAKSALKAKIEGKQALLASSGFPLLEDELYAFFKELNQSDIVRGLVTELNRFIEQTLQLLDQQGNGASITRIDEFYAEIARRESSLRASLKALLETKSDFIQKRAFSIISADPEGTQRKVQELIQGSSTEIFSELEAELRRLVADASLLLDDMLENLQIKGQVDMPQVGFETPSNDDSTTLIQKKSFDFGLLETGVRQVGSLVKPEHVVSALKMGKDLLPSLFKGIGPVTMGKIGEQVIGKVVPAIGLAVQAVQTLYSLVAEDPEEARIRNEARQREQQDERRNQAIRDASENVAWEFRTSLLKFIEENLRDNFTQVNDKLKLMRTSFSHAERERSEDRSILVKAQADLEAYV